MDLLSEGRTTVVIAHRLATAARADRILVLDRGQIVEDGAHEGLLAAGGRYASLWEAYEGVPTGQASSLRLSPMGSPGT